MAECGVVVEGASGTIDKTRPRKDWTATVQCRYFLHGVCRAGKDCTYAHDLDAKSDNVCRYYLVGACSYGDQCRYDHEKPRDKRNTDSRAVKPLNPTNAGKYNSPSISSQLVSLKKGTDPTKVVSSQDQSSEWAKAAEFVPGKMWPGAVSSSYLGAAQKGLEHMHLSEYDCGAVPASMPTEPTDELCPYAAHGQCWYGDNCTYVHGEACELCGKQVLHPTDKEQQNEHQKECIKKHEEDMEHSFAIARSKEKTCGICMELVMDKKPSSEARFGILSDCNHIFCLSCIRRWRQAKQFENKIVRSCPECRTKSDFVTPSRYWVDDQEDKKKLITSYKAALSAKPCKYFEQGKGECPFNNNCFYRHAYPDGRLASPKPIRRRRKENADAVSDVIEPYHLWDFLEEHRRRLTELSLDLQEDFELLLIQAGLWDSDDDESDLSDFDGFL